MSKTEMDPYDAKIHSIDAGLLAVENSTLRAEVAKWQAMVGVGTKEDAAEIATLRARVAELEGPGYDFGACVLQVREIDRLRAEIATLRASLDAALARVGVLEWAVRTLLDERDGGNRLTKREEALIRAALSPADAPDDGERMIRRQIHAAAPRVKHGRNDSYQITQRPPDPPPQDPPAIPLCPEHAQSRPRACIDPLCRVDDAGLCAHDVLQGYADNLNAASAEIRALRAVVTRLDAAIDWAMGRTDFRPREPGDPPYWWRTELDRRAAAPREPKAPAPKAPEPPPHDGEGK